MTKEELTLMYFRNANSLLRIAFDRKGDATYCEVYDPKSNAFARHNEILDDILNDHETEQLTEEQAVQYIHEMGGPEVA